MDFNKEILNYIKPEYIDECKARMGASFKVYPSKTKIGFLVLGINPAGDEKDTIFEKQDNYFYLNFIEGFKKNKYTSPVYFKQVYVLAEKVFDKVKWDWCNLSSKELEHYLDINDFSLNEKDKIRKHFIGHKDNFLGTAFIIRVRMGDGVGAGGKVSPERYDSLVLLWQEDAILIVLSSCYHLQHSVHVAVATGLD